MVRLVDFALNYLACNINSNAANFIFQVVDCFLAFLCNISFGSGTQGGCFGTGLTNNFFFALLGAGGCLTLKRIAFIPDALQVLLVFLFQLGSLLFGCIRIGVHGINFRLAVVDHFFDRFEQELFEHRKGDHHIAESEQRCPRVDANKAFKARHEPFLLSFSAIVSIRRRTVTTGR